MFKLLTKHRKFYQPFVFFAFFDKPEKCFFFFLRESSKNNISFQLISLACGGGGGVGGSLGFKSCRLIEPKLEFLDVLLIEIPVYFFTPSTFSSSYFSLFGCTQFLPLS